VRAETRKGFYLSHNCCGHSRITENIVFLKDFSLRELPPYRGGIVYLSGGLSLREGGVKAFFEDHRLMSFQNGQKVEVVNFD